MSTPSEQATSVTGANSARDTNEIIGFSWDIPTRENTHTPSFHQFLKIPVELQVAVWKYAQGDFLTQFAMLSTCAQSRHIGYKAEPGDIAVKTPQEYYLLSEIVRTKRFATFFTISSHHTAESAAVSTENSLPIKINLINGLKGDTDPLKELTDALAKLKRKQKIGSVTFVADPYMDPFSGRNMDVDTKGFRWTAWKLINSFGAEVEFFKKREGDLRATSASHVTDTIRDNRALSDPNLGGEAEDLLDRLTNISATFNLRVWQGNTVITTIFVNGQRTTRVEYEEQI